MVYSAETLTLRDGREIMIRSVEPKDAAGMLQYMKIMLGETPFLLRTPEEFDYTPEEEAQVKALLKECMENACTLQVPLTVEVKSGNSWYETK